jgi:hypothetical protein
MKTTQASASCSFTQDEANPAARHAIAHAPRRRDTSPAGGHVPCRRTLPLPGNASRRATRSRRATHPAGQHVPQGNASRRTTHPAGQHVLQGRRSGCGIYSSVEEMNP